MSDAIQGDFEHPPVLLNDGTGQPLSCTVEKMFELNGRQYLLLFPVDAPIQVFMQETEDPGSEVLVDVDEADLEALLPTAKAVLAEQNLTLRATAITLTATGDLPEPDEEQEDGSCLTLEIDLDDEEDEATEDFQVLAKFYDNRREYLICTPLNPLLIFAYKEVGGTVAIVEPEEFQRIRADLEEKLFDIFE